MQICKVGSEPRTKLFRDLEQHCGITGMMSPVRISWAWWPRSFRTKVPVLKCSYQQKEPSRSAHRTQVVMALFQHDAVAQLFRVQLHALRTCAFGCSKWHSGVQAAQPGMCGGNLSSRHMRLSRAWLRRAAKTTLEQIRCFCHPNPVPYRALQRLSSSGFCPWLCRGVHDKAWLARFHPTRLADVAAFLWSVRRFADLAGFPWNFHGSNGSPRDEAV